MNSRLLILTFVLLGNSACVHHEEATIRSESGEPKPASGGTPGAKGNGGGAAPMKAYVGPFQQWQIASKDPKAPYANPFYQTIQMLRDEGGINCANIRAISALGIRLMKFYSQVEQKLGSDVLRAPPISYDETLKKLADPEICVDLVSQPDADRRKAKIFLQKKNTFAGSDPSLMALNFSDSGEVYYFTDNLAPEALLKNYQLDLAEIVPVGTSAIDPLLHTADMQANWILLTFLTLGTHEEMSLQGITDERNSKYLYSSNLMELFSLNFEMPRIKSQLLIESTVAYFEKAFEELATLKENKEKSLSEFLKGPDFASRLEVEVVARDLRALYLGATRVRDSYRRALNFFELVVPGTLRAPDHFLENPDDQGGVHPYTQFLRRFTNLGGKAQELVEKTTSEVYEFTEKMPGFVPQIDFEHSTMVPKTANEIKGWSFSPFPDVFQDPDVL